MVTGTKSGKNSVKTKSGKRVRVRKPNQKLDKVFPAKSYKQYVNMAQGNNRSHHGRKITISARVKPRKAAIAIEWVLDTPGAPNANRAGLTPANRAFISGITSVTDAKGVATITLTLSNYGGDKFRVGARIKGNKKYIYSGWFRTWRKLYYDIVEMKTKDGASKYAMPNDVVNRIKAGYAKTFVELQDTGTRHLGTYKDNFDTIEKGFKWADGYCSNTGVPQKIHFCVIDHAAPRNGTYGAQTKTIQEDAGAALYTSTATIRPYDFTGHNWLVKAEYEIWTMGILGLQKKWKTFGAGKVTLVGTRGRRKFKVDFSGSGRTPSATNKVKIKLTYLQPGSYGGWGGSNSLHLLICRGEYLDLLTEAAANNQIVVAGMHEVGHAMGLVNAAAAWHDAAHNGHCIHNTCTMWYASAPGNETFHDEATSDPGCRTFVRGADLTTTVLATRWKFPR